MRRNKRWLALLLAAGMTFSGMGNPAFYAQAAEVTGSAADDQAVLPAADSTFVAPEKLTKLKTKATIYKELSESEQKFDGTKVIDISTECATNLYKVNTGTVILRFKVDPGIGTEGVILGSKAKTANISTPTDLKAGQNYTAFSMKSAGEFKMTYHHTRASLSNLPYPFTDGNWHCAIVSSNSSGKYMRLTVDGQELWNNTVATNMGMFAKQTSLDQVTIGGFQSANGTISNPFKGEISHVIVTSEELSDADAVEISRALYSGTVRQIYEMFTTTDPDNSWVFTGGSVVKGGFEQTRGMRNYVGHFEEYVRWEKNGSEMGRQRYTVNTGKNGRTLAEIVENYDNLVKKYAPKAAAYMIGKEDYSAGEEGLAAFKANLKSFIDKSLALKENNKGFAVIQEAFATSNAATNALIQKYCDAVDEVVAQYEADAAKASRIVVVDHFAQTNTDTFKSTCLLNEDTLNQKGHLEIGRQFCVATYGSASPYPNAQGLLDVPETPMPDEYLDVLPQVTARKNKLDVTVPAEAGEGNWSFIVKTDGVQITGTETGNQFTIEGLPEGKNYVLVIRSADGSKQITSVMGTITDGNVAKKNEPTLTAAQQKIVDKVKGDKPLTWLFMGDSITHAALWTKGYDGIAQSFEKFVNTQLGRVDDVVINTAVSSADTKTTIASMQYRLTQYAPDIVSIMLGTNDLAVQGITVDVYKTNLKTIIDEARRLKPDVSIILRTPTATWSGRETTIPSYIAAMKEVADADADIIFVEQYEEMQEALGIYPWLKNNQILFGNNLHPGVLGHLYMTRHFIQGIGLWTEDGPITNLNYEEPITNTSSAITPVLSEEGQKISLNIETLQTSYGQALGETTLEAVDASTGQTYTISAPAGSQSISLNLPSGDYTIKVSSVLRASATRAVFAEQKKVYYGDKAELEALIESYAQLKEADYTSETWQAFTAAMGKADEVLKGGDVVQKVIDDAEDALKAAADSLEKRVVEKEPSFHDVQKGDWFYNAVKYANNHKIMTGLDKDYFGPDQTLVRAQFATILYRMEEKPKVTFSQKFHDVGAGEFFTEAVLWAASDDVRVVTGYTNGNFGPNDTITREQMALMMHRYAKYKGYDVSGASSLDKYPDVGQVNSYAKTAMEWCVGKGIITGKGSGDNKTLDPQGNATRAECAAIIQRFLQKYEK